MVTDDGFSEEEPCGVEGCGRSVLPYGDDVPCGLLKLFGREDPPAHLKLRCGTEILVDRWIAEGLFDGIDPELT